MGNKKEGLRDFERLAERQYLQDNNRIFHNEDMIPKFKKYNMFWVG